MALNKYKLGELIAQRREKYNLQEKLPIRGVSKEGFIMPKQDATDFSIYNVFYYNDFVFNPARMELNSIALNQQFEKGICSSLYEIFYVSRPDLVLPEYLSIFIKRDEFARLCWFNAVGSARNYFRVDDLNELVIELPSIEIQKKYVDIYKGMLENQRAYEEGLEDLKLVCDATIEDLRRKYPCEKIEKYITQITTKNTDMSCSKVLGISKEGFIEPKQDPGDLNNYFVFDFNSFVYSPPRINIGSIGLYKTHEKAICSPIYVVFKVNNEKILVPDYLAMWLKRTEFFRSTDFYSITSVRNNFSYDLMEEVEIPIPSINIQQDIVNIFNSYNERKQINEELKNQIKDICPILIKGAIKEGSNGTER